MTRLGQLAGLAGSVWLLAACDVATVDQAPSTIAQNQCSSDSDCPGGACVVSQCRSRNGSLEKLLFEVTPPADGSLIAGVQFLLPDTTVHLGGDSAQPMDLALVSQLVGEVTLGNRKCVPKFDNAGTVLAIAGDSSIPAFVTLTPSATALGLSSPPAVVKTLLTKMSYYSFSVNVPSGDYDIYVEPEHQMEESCPVPPQLRRKQHINSGALKLGVQLPEPNSFEFHVSWPLGDGALNGWVVDMLDPVTGRVISNRVQLALGTQGKTDYVATLSYAPVLVGETSAEEAEELVRLSPPDRAPPDQVTAPTVLLARSALALFDANKGLLSNFTSLPIPIHLQGQVTRYNTPQPVASTVTLVATDITGVDQGVLATFVRKIDVGPDGQFDLDVLPGHYHVSAVPLVELNSSSSTDSDTDAESRLAAASQTWTVPSSPSVQAGKLIALGPALGINGVALDSRDNAVATALVQAVASPGSIQSDVLHQALGESSYLPRASTATVSPKGDFGLLADAGMFDVTVRPLDNTGFGWMVFPRVGVGTTRANSAGWSLGSQSIPLPVSYAGTVTVPGPESTSQPVPNALIRAYIYVSNGEYVADASKADSVLQVAETRADKNGRFEVLIPATVNPPPQQ